MVSLCGHKGPWAFGLAAAVVVGRVLHVHAVCVLDVRRKYWNFSLVCFCFNVWVPVMGRSVMHRAPLEPSLRLRCFLLLREGLLSLGIVVVGVVRGATLLGLSKLVADVAH